MNKLFAGDDRTLYVTPNYRYCCLTLNIEQL